MLLDGLYLVFSIPCFRLISIGPQAQSDWEIIDTISPKVKDEAIKQFTEAAIQKLEQKVKEGMAYEGKMTFWERMMIKGIDNVQITIKQVFLLKPIS